jgi:hypothetical protein
MGKTVTVEFMSSEASRILRARVKAGDIVCIGVVKSKPHVVSYVSPTSGIVRIKKQTGGFESSIQLLSKRLSPYVKRVSRRGKDIYRRKVEPSGLEIGLAFLPKKEREIVS